MPARAIDTNNIVDTSWVKQSFMMGSPSISAEDALYRTLTTAAYKFADTTPGGNAAINPPPQFTRYADIKVGGDGTNQTPGSYRPSNSRGMGRYYSEAIDDNAVHAYMRFGVPQYNSLTNFFTNFYNAEASAMARTGRSTSLFFKAGQVVGFIVGIVPRALVFMGNVARWFMNRPASKYYYLKPTMLPYWNAVTTIVNTLATNMGIIPPLIGTSTNFQNFTNDPTDQNPTSITATQMNASLHTMLPQIFRADGGIDVYALSTRYQMLFQQYQQAGFNAIANAGVTDSKSNDPAQTELLRQALASFQMTAVSVPGSSAISQLGGENANIDPTTGNPQNLSGLDAYAAAYMTYAPNQTAYTAGGATTVAADNSAATNGNTASTDTADGATDAAPANTGNDSSTESIDAPGTANPNFGGVPGGGYSDSGGWFENFYKFTAAELSDGGAFVSFRVDGTGTINEGFSNSSKQSEIQQKINSMSASNRDTRFNIESGNLVGGALGSLVSGVTGAVGDFIKGIGSEVGLAGLAALAGSAFVDIPETWDSSTANLPRADFTVQLRSPYGNKMSRLLNLYIPLAMLLAGALPLATGKQSYTSPFLCEMYCRGRMTCRLGMIDSLQITRGTGNIGWTEDGEPLGIDVSFSIKDFSSVMFMPISQHFTALQAAGQAIATSIGTVLDGPAGGAVGSAAASSLMNSTWDDDNAYTDYMAVLGSLTMTDQISQFRKWKLRLTNQAANYNAWKSPAHAAAWFTQTWPGRILSGFTPAARLGQNGA